MDERGGEIGRHIVLVGLPGAGKTAVGARVAQELGLGFLDFDQEIERRQSLTVAEIFATAGEARFRALEAELTREAATSDAMVLAPGGGWIMQPGLVELIRPPACLVHLRVGPETALTRIAAQPGTRPLLAGTDPLVKLHALWELRREAYASADHEVDTEGITVEEVAARVVALIGRSAR